MWTYVLRRLLWMIPTLFGITVLVWLLMIAAPGEPSLDTQSFRGEESLQRDPQRDMEAGEAARLFRRQFGLDRPAFWNTWLGLDAETVREDVRLASGDINEVGSAPKEKALRRLEDYGQYSVPPLIELLETTTGAEQDGVLYWLRRNSLRQIVRRGGGAVLLSAHVTNWELLGACVSRELERPLVSVVLPHADLRVNQLFARRRLAGKVRAIMIGKQTTRACLKVLSRGGTVGLLGDHCFGAPGAPVALFGRRSLLPTGPALLSWRARVPLIPIFMLREESGLFRVHLEEPVWPAALSVGFREASRMLMSAYARALERIVRQAPGQWLLFRPLELVPETAVLAQGSLR